MEIPSTYAISKCLLMRQPRDFLVILLREWLTMEECGRLDSAMSENIGRLLLLEVLSSGNVWYRGSKDGEDYIDAQRLSWLSKRGVGVISLSCWHKAGGDNSHHEVHADMAVSVAKKCPNLKSLYLWHWWDLDAGFLASHMKEIATTCPNIETLDIRYSEYCIDDAVFIEAATRLHKLNTLTLDHCRLLSDDSCIALSLYCTHLQEVEISHCYWMTDDGIIHLAQSCPHMKSLKISNLIRITDASIMVIANNCNSLVTLDLSSIYVRNDTIIHLVQQCPLLENISLSWSAHITDTALIHIANMCQSLTHINISRCNEITDEGVMHLVTMRGSNMRYLNISHCTQLTDIAVHAIAHHCPNLINLEIHHLDNVTDLSLMQIAENCIYLTYINVSNCNNITDVSLNRVYELCQDLQSIDLVGCPFVTAEMKDRFKLRCCVDNTT